MGRLVILLLLLLAYAAYIHGVLLPATEMMAKFEADSGYHEFSNQWKKLHGREQVAKSIDTNEIPSFTRSPFAFDIEPLPSTPAPTDTSSATHEADDKDMQVSTSPPSESDMTDHPEPISVELTAMYFCASLVFFVFFIAIAYITKCWTDNRDERATDIVFTIA